MLRLFRKAKQSPPAAEFGLVVSRITHNAQTSTLAVDFSDGSTRTHVHVQQGFVVGLQVAEDKLSYYTSQIAPRNHALELQKEISSKELGQSLAFPDIAPSRQVK